MSINIFQYYPIFKNVCKYLDEFEIQCIIVLFHLPFKQIFKNGKSLIQNAKPLDFQNLNLDHIDFLHFNWDACCRHRKFSKREIVKFRKFINFKQIFLWNNFSFNEKLIFLYNL